MAGVDGGEVLHLVPAARAGDDHGGSVRLGADLLDERLTGRGVPAHQTGGNLEVASAYNNITSAYNAGKTAMDYASGFRELSNPELAKNVLDLTKAGYLNPPLPPGWGKGAQGNFCPAPGR